MHEKKVWKEAGGFCESLRRFQDWEFFMRLLLKKKYSFYFNDEILCHNYIQEDSIGFRNDLFWNARLYIFEEFIDVCRDMGLVVDVVLSMLEDVNIEFITPVQSERILSLMSGEEKTELFKIYQRYYNHYISSTKISEEYLSLAMKNHLILTLEGKWIAVTQRGGKVIDYFHRYKVRSICIYGFGVLGKLLWEELKNTDILVKIIIDEMITSDSVIIFKPNDVKVFLVDLIVVTVIGSFEEIRKNLEKKTAVKIISLNEVIETLYCNSMKSDIKDCFQ